MRFQHYHCRSAVSLDTGRVITGYAAVFWDGSEGSQYAMGSACFERLHADAFNNTIRQDDVRALFNHDRSLVLGRTKNNTLKLSTDKHGLRFSVELADTETGDTVLKLVRRRDLTGCSFSFQPVRQFTAEEPSGKFKGKLVRVLREVKLFDVGPVTFPAYEGTSVWADGGQPSRDAIRTRARVVEISANL